MIGPSAKDHALVGRLDAQGDIDQFARPLLEDEVRSLRAAMSEAGPVTVASPVNPLVRLHERSQLLDELALRVRQQRVVQLLLCLPLPISWRCTCRC